MEITLEDFIRWFNTPFIHIGDSPLTVSGLGMSGVIVIVALFLSAFIRRSLTPTLQKKFNLEQGVVYAIERFVHYGIVIMGVMIACQSIGLNLGSLAVIFGFLSVGIGFGLQNVTSNFISGLILLLERPISIGDFIEVTGQRAKVLHIRMRSTIVMTMDNVTIIVPNSYLIENQVTNWSIEDRRVRLHCPVGVAYGSDVPLVKKTLLEVARSHEAVLKNPEPIVRFLEFGNSALNFDLLFWVSDLQRMDDIPSDINYKIDQAFRGQQYHHPVPAERSSPEVHYRSKTPYIIF